MVRWEFQQKFWCCCICLFWFFTLTRKPPPLFPWFLGSFPVFFSGIIHLYSHIPRKMCCGRFIPNIPPRGGKERKGKASGSVFPTYNFTISFDFWFFFWYSIRYPMPVDLPFSFRTHRVLFPVVLGSVAAPPLSRSPADTHAPARGCG